jgi:oligopeptide transport system substrate-binding protein
MIPTVAELGLGAIDSGQSSQRGRDEIPELETGRTTCQGCVHGWRGKAGPVRETDWKRAGLRLMRIFGNGEGRIRTPGQQLALLGLGAVALFLLAMVGLSWATGQSSVAPGVDPKTRTVTMALGNDPPQMNSSLSADSVSGFVLGHVEEGLLRFDENNQLVPGVAERWEITSDGATFWLRADAKWSDGKPVTAHDFVFAWRNAVNPQSASSYAFIMYGIRNAQAINSGELPIAALGVRAVSDRELRVDFAYPVPYFPQLTAFNVFYPIREDFYRSTQGRYGSSADTLLYNGPFRMTKWVHGAHIRLEKNPHYWDRENIHIEVLDFPYFTVDPSATINLFRSGKLAMAGIGQENLEDAQFQRWKIESFMDGTLFYLELNHRPGRATANRNLRKAIQHTLDSAELVNQVIKIPGYLPGKSLFPVWLDGVEEKFRTEYPAEEILPDRAAARRYLQQARREMGVERLPPLTLLADDGPTVLKQAEYIQERLKRELGIDVRIDSQIFKQRLAKMEAGDFDLVMAGWGPDYADPLTFGDLFSSDNDNNRGQYRNAEMDRMVAIARNSTDPRTRMDAFGRIQQIIIDDAVILPMYERSRLGVSDPRLKGVVRRVTGADPDLTRARIVAEGAR